MRYFRCLFYNHRTLRVVVSASKLCRPSAGVATRTRRSVTMFRLFGLFVFDAFVVRFRFRHDVVWRIWSCERRLQTLWVRASNSLCTRSTSLCPQHYDREHRRQSKEDARVLCKARAGTEALVRRRSRWILINSNSIRKKDSKFVRIGSLSSPALCGVICVSVTILVFRLWSF